MVVVGNSACFGYRVEWVRIRTVQHPCTSPHALASSPHAYRTCLYRTRTQAVVVDPVVAFSLRPAPGKYSYVRMSADDITWEEMTVAEYLKFKERLVGGVFL